MEDDVMELQLEVDQDTLAVDFIDQLTMHSLRDIIRLLTEVDYAEPADLEYNAKVVDAARTILEYMGLPNVD
jgi:hypothetical protein